MKTLPKGALAFLGLLAIILILTAEVTSAQTTLQPTAKDKALSFIQDVIQPNLSQYTVTLVHDISGQSPIQASETQESVDYHFTNNESEFDVICMFTNNILTYAQLATNRSSTFQNSFSSNVTNVALVTLEGYQTYTGENLHSMVETLTGINALQNTTKIAGDIKLVVQQIKSITEISWENTYNGTDYTGISVAFKNGQFYTFSDDRCQWTIGNTDVNVSQSQAISIAQQYLQNYSYTLDDGTVVKGFNVTSIQAGLNTYPRGNTTTIYPYWSVQLFLGNTYPGNVYALSFGIWADSGTVFLSQPLGVEGLLPPANPTATMTEQTQSQGTTGISALDFSILIGVIASIALISAVFIKKQSK